MQERHQWSSLNKLQLGRYAEHLAMMRFVEAGLEVYSTEVDDRGIDCLVRYAPGRCLEVQVKSVRKRGEAFIEKKHLGSTPEEIIHRLRSGYCMAFLPFEDGREPDMYLIPGYAWLEPNSLLKDYKKGDRSVGPNIAVNPVKKNSSLLERYRFSQKLLGEIIEEIRNAGKEEAGENI